MNYYCKLSCDDWSSDLDVYELDGEFVTSVATFRYRFNDPLPKVVEDAECNHVAFVKRELQVLRLLDRADKELILVPGIAGCSFLDRSAAECGQRMRSLIAMGFRVPKEAEERLRQRIEEQEKIHA